MQNPSPCLRVSPHGSSRRCWRRPSPQERHYQSGNAAAWLLFPFAEHGTLRAQNCSFTLLSFSSSPSPFQKTISWLFRPGDTSLSRTRRDGSQGQEGGARQRRQLLARAPRSAVQSRSHRSVTRTGVSSVPRAGLVPRVRLPTSPNLLGHATETRTRLSRQQHLSPCHSWREGLRQPLRPCCEQARVAPVPHKHTDQPHASRSPREIISL